MLREDDNDIQYKVKLGTWKKIISIVFRSKKRIFLSIFLLINYSIYYFWQIINKMKDFFSLIEYLFVEILRNY